MGGRGEGGGGAKGEGHSQVEMNLIQPESGEARQTHGVTPMVLRLPQNPRKAALYASLIVLLIFTTGVNKTCAPCASLAGSSQGLSCDVREPESSFSLIECSESLLVFSCLCSPCY